MKTRQVISAGVLTVGALLSYGSQAATCTGVLVGTTCTLEGPNVKWIYDTATDAGAMGLFGAPTLVGDSIRFLPPAFKAESLNGVGGTVTATAYFIFDHVINKNGGEIISVTSLDFGDYSILGGDRVHADLYLNSANNNPSDPLGFTQLVQSFNATVATGGAATPWTLTTTINPAAAMAGFAGDVTLGVQDTLSATTTLAGQDAWIQKKIQLDAIVPVPAAFWLFGSAMAGLGGLRRRMA